MEDLDDEIAMQQHLLADDSLTSNIHIPPTMSVAQRIMLSPYEKWQYFRRIPYKPILHLLLLLLTFTQLIIYDAQNASYMRASHRNWAYFFLPPIQDVGIMPRFQRDLYTINQTISTLSYMRQAYFSIVNSSVANYAYHNITSSHGIRPLDLYVTTRIPFTQNKYSMDQYSSDIGPFQANWTYSQRQRYVRNIDRMDVYIVLRDVQYGNYYPECFDWKIHVSMKSVQQIQWRVQVETCEIATCSTFSLWTAMQQLFVWLHMLTASVTAVYMVLSIRALRRSYQLVAQASSMVQQEKLPFSLRIKLFNRFQVLVLLTLSFLLTSSLWSLLFFQAHVPLSLSHRLLHSTAILLLWSTLVGYVEHNRQIYSIVLTLKWGAPRVLQFVLGVSPIFFGFALFGTIAFGPQVKAFGSISQSMMTLFAVMNGDVILDTFDALDLHGFGTLGKIYLYVFISLFIYVVLNIFIAIVEEAFFATRNCRRMLDVLLTDLKYEPRDSRESEISSEMVRLLMRAMEHQDKD